MITYTIDTPNGYVEMPAESEDAARAMVMTTEHIEMETEAAEWAAIGTPESMDCADRLRQSITADRMEIWDRTGVRPWDPIGSRTTEQ